MGYLIRRLTHEDFEASMALGKYAFRIELNDEQLNYQQKNFISEIVTRYGLFEGEKLCSQLTHLHYNFVVQGKSIKGSGIGFVSSWPEFRRKGYVAKLIEYSLKIMKDEGEIISVLHPFSVAFYRKFGFELLSQRVKNLLPINQIKRHDLQGEIIRVSNYEELKSIYDEYSKQYNGLIARGDYHWQDAVPRRKKGSVIIYKNDKGEKRGYMIYIIAPQSTKFEILEFIALDKEAHQALWSFVGQHDSMVEQVEWLTPLSDGQYAELTDPRISRQIEQYGMVRIVDCKVFISQFNFVAKITDTYDTYYLQIEDKYAEWNNGLFKLTINTDGQAKLQETNKEEMPEQAVIKMTINTLSGLLIGYYTASQLIWNERIVGDSEAIAAFIKRIPQQNTQLLDFF